MDNKESKMTKAARVVLGLLVLPLMIPLVQAATTQIGNMVNIGQFGGTSVSLGAKPSASSIPVVLATDSSAITASVNGSTVAVTNVNGQNLNVAISGSLPAGSNTIGAVINPPNQAIAIVSTNTLTVGGSVSVSNFPATQTITGAVSQSGSYTVTPGTGTFPVSGTFNQNSYTVTPGTGTFSVSGSVSVSNFPATQIVAIAAGTTLPVVSTTTQTTQFVPVATITNSSVTVTSGASVQVFASDTARKTYSITSLPTNTDIVFCRWGSGSAVATDVVILSPGSNISPSGAVETTAFSCIANSGSQVIRGYSAAP